MIDQVAGRAQHGHAAQGGRYARLSVVEDAQDVEFAGPQGALHQILGAGRGADDDDVGGQDPALAQVRDHLRPDQVQAGDQEAGDDGPDAFEARGGRRGRHERQHRGPAAAGRRGGQEHAADPGAEALARRHPIGPGRHQHDHRDHRRGQDGGAGRAVAHDDGGQDRGGDEAGHVAELEQPRDRRAGDAGADRLQSVRPQGAAAVVRFICGEGAVRACVVRHRPHLGSA